MVIAAFSLLTKPFWWVGGWGGRTSFFSLPLHRLFRYPEKYKLTLRVKDTSWSGTLYTNSPLMSYIDFACVAKKSNLATPVLTFPSAHRVMGEWHG